jgi:hypothetical protein
VIERVRLAGEEDAHVDAEVAERRVTRLEGYTAPPFASLRTARASARLRTNQPSDVM